MKEKKSPSRLLHRLLHGRRADSFALSPEELATLSKQGWVCPRLRYKRAGALAQGMRTYFARPLPEKQQGPTYASKDERGYGRGAGGGKEMYFVRTQPLPSDFDAEATAFWIWSHRLALSLLRQIAVSCNMPAEALSRVVEAGSAIPQTAPNSNLLRLFHYLPGEGLAAGVHRDAGLLAIGLHTAPGLQACDGTAWTDTERGIADDAVVIMVGRTLTRLTSLRYNSCVHRVCRGAAARLSMVYHLRVRRDAVLRSADFPAPQGMAPLPPFEATGEELHEFFARALTSTNAFDPT